jgi:hypothetical protein
LPARRAAGILPGMANEPRELRPMAVFAALAAGTGAVLILVSAMSAGGRLLGSGMLCLTVGALTFLIWALAAAGELRRRVLERVAERPQLDDAEFAARFFPEIPARHGAVARIRRTIAGRFAVLGGAGFWPEDRLNEDLHLGELAPAELADLPDSLRRELRLDPERRLDQVDWCSIEDVYLAALGAMDEPPQPPEAGRPGDAPVQ